MAKKKAAKKKPKSFEETLWDSANKLRGSVEPAEYKHVVLSLIFLKFASDKFVERREEIVDEGKGDFIDMVEFYTMKNVFFLPEESRWSFIQANAKQDDLTLKIDTALHTIEKNNKSLAGALPDNYFSRLDLDRSKLAALIDTISNINTLADKSQDVVGRVYEYFLGKFAAAEGKGKGEFYTPKSVVTLMAEMIEPYQGKVYDPCCGSGGMFVQSVKFVESHQGNSKNVSIYGQEFTSTTYKLAKMNLAIRGISGNLGAKAADTFHNDQHRDLKADFILANPPFNLKDWRASDELVDDPRWAGYEVPPTSNANYAWILHIVSKLSANGTAGFVMANGSLSTNMGNEGRLRQQIIGNDLVDCIVLLPGHLFFNMYSQVCLWFLTKNKRKTPFRERAGEVLFIDASDLGELTERTHRELKEDDVARIANTYRSWNGSDSSQEYKNVPGFCYSATNEEIRHKGFNLIPARYVGSAERAKEAIPTGKKIERLAKTLDSLIAQRVEFLSGLSTAHKWLLGTEVVPDDLANNNCGAGGLDQSIVQNLEDFKNTLFDSWFIEFEPITRPDDLQPLNCELMQSVFPTQLVESVLGDLPKGWSVLTYGDILTHVVEKNNEANIPEYSATVRGLESRSLRFNKKLSNSSSKNKIIRKGELVFGLSRTSLNFGLMTDEIGSVSPVYEVFKVDSNQYLPGLLELYIRRNMKLHMDILKSGAREGAPIDRDYFLNKEVLVPDKKVQELFARIVFGSVE